MNHQTVISHTSKELEKLIQKSNADFRRQIIAEKKRVAFGAKWADKSERLKLDKNYQEHKRYNQVVLDQHREIVKQAIADGITVPQKVADEFEL